jgi:hypothetical protein
MAKHTIEIRAFPPVAVVAPGIRDVCKGDEITFVNKTGGPLKIFTAEDKVFKGIGRLDPQNIYTKKNKKFTVEASEGTYELAIHYKYDEMKKGKKKTRTGFALGASSPKIIVVPPKKR